MNLAYVLEHFPFDDCAKEEIRRNQDDLYVHYLEYSDFGLVKVVLGSLRSFKKNGKPMLFEFTRI